MGGGCGCSIGGCGVRAALQDKASKRPLGSHQCFGHEQVQ